MADDLGAIPDAATDEAPGVAKRGVCPVCGLGCFVQAKIVDNVPVSIHPDHQSGHPADCPRAGQARDYHDHAERLNYPLKRVGARGEGKWERIGWDQAMDEIAAKLKNIRDQHGPEAVQLMGGSLKGPSDAANWRFANLFGTPNILHQGKNCGEAEVLAEWATYGELTAIGGAPAVPGLTRCVILWGANPAVGKGIRAKRLYAELRKAGGVLIVVDPARTEMTEMADLWLQLRPGTDGALAYAMLNVIIGEKLYDADFVDKWCLGFDELAATVAPYTPEVAAKITWVPAELIIEAARTYANGPSLLPFGLGAAELGKATTSAVFGKTYLRAITGNLDREGGSRFADLPESAALRADMQWDYLLDHPLRTRDNVSADIWPVASVKGMKAFRAAMAKVHPQGVGPAQYMMFAAPSSVWTAILDQDPYPVKALICQGGNAMVALGDARRIHAALASDNLELSVNMDHWITPGGQLADYLLPATDGLERPLLGNMWGFGDTYEAGVRLVAPRYERRDDYQLWRDLGNRLGQAGHWPDTAEGWFDRLLAPAGLTHAELADQPSPWLRGPTGTRRYEARGFPTTSGKVELASSLMAGLGYPAIPDYEAPAWSPEATPELLAEFPLILTTGSGLKWYYRSQQRHLAKMRKQHGYARCTLHPDTAAELGIVEGEMVWVETPMGRVRQEARLDDGMLRGVAHADSHFWYPEQAAQAPGLYGVWESNINAILPDSAEHSDFAGDCYMRGLLCRVYPEAAAQAAE